jgi:hypothetical protein
MSTMMEMMGVKAAQVEEKKNPNNLNYKAAFGSFLRMMKDMADGHGMLVFYDYYGPDSIPEFIRSQRPLLLDPTSPYNNLLGSCQQSTSGPKKQKGIKDFLRTFGGCAENSLRILAQEPFLITQLFLPQPMMWNTPMAKIFVIKEILCGCVFDSKCQLPKFEIRRKFSPELKHCFTKLLYVFSTAVKSAEAEKQDISLVELKEMTKKLVDQMSNGYYRWTPDTSVEHAIADMDVTFKIPLRQWKMACYVSFNIKMC